MDKVGQIKRFIQDKEAAIEGVSNFEFGVLGFLDDELLIAKIAEGAMPVGHPRNLDMVADSKIHSFDVR